MLLESDILRLFFTGPFLSPRLSVPVSGVDCPSVDPRQLLLPASLLSCDQLLCSCPTTNSVYWVASSTLIRLPVPLPGTARFHVQESFVWFRAKTDSSALAANPHSATLANYTRLSENIQHIEESHKLPHKSDSELECKISCRKTTVAEIKIQSGV